MRAVLREYKREFIFSEAPFASCHASTILPLGEERAFAAWFGGSREGADDVQIWGAARSADGWSAPRPLTREPEIPHWNPVLLAGEDAMILYYKTGREIAGWKTMVSKSRDDGRTWSEGRELVPGDRAGGRGPVRNKVLRLASGRLAAPASVEQGEWRAFADLSDDGGRTWRKSTEIRASLRSAARLSAEESDIPLTQQSFTGRGVIQPTLWESAPGQVHMLLRSSEGRVYRSDSQDSGETWSPAYPTELPNNNSGIDLTRHSDGKLYLVYNPVELSFGPRTPLLLACSADNGHTWQTLCTLEDEPGEYSYPAIVSRGDRLWITYTWRRQRIACRIFECS